MGIHLAKASTGSHLVGSHLVWACHSSGRSTNAARTLRDSNLDIAETKLRPMPGAGRPTDYSSRTPQRTGSHYFGGSPSFASVGRAPSGARSLTSARCLKRALSLSLSRRTELRRTGLPRRTDLRRTGLPHADPCRPYLRLPFLWWVSLSFSPAGPNSVGPVFPAGPISVGPAFLIPISVGISLCLSQAPIPLVGLHLSLPWGALPLERALPPRRAV